MIKTKYSLNETIPVAFATDKNYIVPTLVAVKSLVIHSNELYNYCIFILCEDDIGSLEKNLFLSVIKGISNINISFITVGEEIKNVKLCENGPTKGISKVTYYRFLLPDLVNHFDKILYLDTDIVICEDVANIYFTKIDDYYLLGVRDIVGYDDSENRCNELHIPALDRYINAGVLLLNLKKLRQTGKAQEMLEASRNCVFPYNDQDIINSLCYDEIGILPSACNVIIDYTKDAQLISEILGIDYEKEISKPIVLHYAGRSKPWYGKNKPYSSYWWDVANSFKKITFFMERIRFYKCIKGKF